MSDPSNAMYAATMDIQYSIDPTRSLEERVRAAMSAAKDHWLARTDIDRFRCAVAAVMISYGDGTLECERLQWEIENIGRSCAFMTAAQSGLSVNLPDEAEANPNGYQPVGLLKMWREAGAI